MKDTKKISYNIIFGFAAEALTILLGFVIPRLTLKSFGSEINGLVNSVSQIYSYVALLEAGIGTATLQALYKTVANKDKHATNRILAATDKQYKRTGIFYILAIAIFSIVYPLVVKTTIPTMTVVLIIILNGAGSVINYSFTAKYFLLLQAQGKNYIQTALYMATNMLKNISRIVLLMLGFDIISVQAIPMCMTIVQAIYMLWYVRKHLKWVDISVEPDFKSISQSKNVFVHKIGELVFNNTDNIVLSIFCGLKVVSVYSMYTMLYSMILTVLGTVSSSLSFKLGQTFHKNKERFMLFYDCYEIYYTAFVFALYTVAHHFILPFIALYTEGITDIEYIDKALPWLFIAIYMLSTGRSAPGLAISISGNFKSTQWRSILESVINIVVSIVCVYFFGIYGVLFGTIAALFYRTNDMIIFANKRVLHRSPLITYKRWLINVATFFLIAFISSFIKLDLTSYFKIILWCVPYTIITLLLFFGIASLAEPKIAKFAIDLILEKFLKRNKKELS
ncbi:MAG TPA: sugar isomerase [Clostridiales bacterium]|nr:sugar isomerase [Clostridiales bacterium]